MHRWSSFYRKRSTIRLMYVYMYVCTDYCLFTSPVDTASIFRSQPVPLAAQCTADVLDSLSRYSTLWSNIGGSLFSCMLWLNDIHPRANVSEEINRKFPARKTTIQLLTLYTDPERHNAQRYRRTNQQTDTRTNDIMTPIADYTV